MTKAARARYTLEFKQEAVRLVESGQSIAAASRTLGLVEQTLFNWVKAHREGTLKGAESRSKVTAEQMEISRLRAELARVTMERDILGKAMAYFAKGQKCQGRSKTRPVWRSKSRPVDSRWLLWDFGVEGRWSVAEAALVPRGALGIGSSVLRMGFVCGGSA